MRDGVRGRWFGWLLAVCVAVAAFGPALHALPGLGDAHHDPDGGPAHHPGSHDDCPICHFLDQDQLAVVASGWAGAGVVRPCQPPITLPVATPRPHAPPSLRGPPPIARPAYRPCLAVGT